MNKIYISQKKVKLIDFTRFYFYGRMRIEPCSPILWFPPPETFLKPRQFAPAHDFWFIWHKTKYQQQICKFRLLFLVLERAGGQFEKNMRALSSYIDKIIYGHKKICRKKKYTREKKIPLITKRSEWVRKKNTAGKKNTADQQKEWVSGSTIFSREKKIRDLWLKWL